MALDFDAELATTEQERAAAWGSGFRFFERRSLGFSGLAFRGLGLGIEV